MATPTTLPVPSTDPNDLLFNAEKLDEAINSTATTYTDRLGVARKTLAGAIATIEALNSRGAWAPATAYALKDLVSESGTWYVCVAAHTSSAAFATDSASKWRVHQGVIAADLAASSGASLMGFLPAGTGGVASTTEAALRMYPHPSQYAANADYVAACQALATGQHWTQNGAIIHRLADRLFVGGAIDNDGALPNVQKDWMATYQVAAGLGNGSTASATSVALTSTAAASNIAHLAGAQSKYATGANQSTIGVFGFALNNHATLATRVWGGYFEAHKETAAGTGARGIEVDVRVVSATAEINPYPNQQTTTSALQLGAGCELAAAGQQNVGAVIQIVDNPMQFRKGIVFGANSLEGSDGASGYGTAVAMAAYQGIDWYSNANVLVGRISAATTTAGGELRFTSTGPLILGQNGLSVARFADTAGAANNLQFAAAATGGAPQIVATGTDANVDLRLTTTGTGVVRFGTMTANADAPITGYISIKDSGGTARKLAVIA